MVKKFKYRTINWNGKNYVMYDEKIWKRLQPKFHYSILPFTGICLDKYKVKSEIMNYYGNLVAICIGKCRVLIYKIDWDGLQIKINTRYDECK